MPSLQEKLSQDVADITWKDLQPHAKRDAIIVIDTELDLSEVAAAIAQDNTDAVQKLDRRSLYCQTPLLNS